MTTKQNPLLKKREDIFEPLSLEIPKYEFDYSKKVNREQLLQAHETAAKKFGYSHLKSCWIGWEDQVMTIVEYKFMLWDYIKAKKYNLEPKHDNHKNEDGSLDQQGLNLAWARFKQSWLLLEDKAIYTYAFLKWNGTQMCYFPYQDAVASCPYKRINVECSNQIGKSMILQCMATTEFFGDHGKVWHTGLVSASKSQNGQNMRMIKMHIENSGIEVEKATEESMSVTTRKSDNGDTTNNLICAVASDSGLGFPFDLLLLDEFEFWSNPKGLEYMYDQVFKARLLDTKGVCVVLSNPNGKNYVSEDLQKRTMTIEYARAIGYTEDEIFIIFGNKREILEFAVFNFNFLDKPGNTMEEYLHEKGQTHPFIFASTMAAQRTESRGAALTKKQIEDSHDPYLTDAGKEAGKGKQCYFFLDVGHVHDQSVLIGMYLEHSQKPASQAEVQKLIDKARKEIDGDNGLNKNHKAFYQHFYPQTYPLWRVIGVNPDNVPDSIINTDDGWQEVAADHPSLVSVAKDYYYNNCPPLIGGDTTKDETLGTLCALAGISLIDTRMTGPWKAHWYGRLTTLMAQRRVRRGHVDNWVTRKNKSMESQMTTLQIRTKKKDGTAMPYATYHHTSEDDLDDAVDALVGCISICDEESVPMASASICGNPEDENTKDIKKDDVEDVYGGDYELIDDFGIPSFNY